MKKLTLFGAFILVVCSLHATPDDIKLPPLLITENEREQIYAIGRANKVPLSITRQLIKEESGGDCHARSKMTKEGYYSKGVLQIYTKPGNVNWLLWKFWKGDPATFDIYDPIDNATLALAYLAWLHERYGNWFLALCYFNHGSIYGYSEETRAYATRIINAR